MKLCCVCGMKLSRKQVRYVEEVTWSPNERTYGMPSGGAIIKRNRIVCPTHEKQINAGQVPVLSE